MTNKSDSTEQPLTEVQQIALSAVLDMIVPRSNDGRLPSAADIDVLGYLIEHESRLIPSLCDALDRLEAAASNRFQAGFGALAAADREALLDEIKAADPQFLSDLAIHTVSAYYQDDGVMKAIGLEARPPFPKGYDVVSGDLSLLDPVRNRGRIWRDAP